MSDNPDFRAMSVPDLVVNVSAHSADVMGL